MEKLCRVCLDEMTEVFDEIVSYQADTMNPIVRKRLFGQLIMILFTVGCIIWALGYTKSEVAEALKKASHPGV